MTQSTSTSTTSDRSYTPDDSAHSSLVGGSSAARRLACPASYQLEQKLPASLVKESSSYADEGTALHEAMAYILDKDITDMDSLVGMVFFDHVITDEHVDEAIIPALEVFDMINAESKEAGGLEFVLEQQCFMPGIPGAKGTSDIIARDDCRSVIVDWKFGAGVPVKAFYEVDGKYKPNPQLMFYARAAMHSLPDMFNSDDPSWPVDLYIVQPRIREELGPKWSHIRVTVTELEGFRLDLVDAIDEAHGTLPARMQRGDHCRFAQCKAICPLHHAPALDLSALGAANALAPAQTNDLDDAAYGQLIATILDLGETLSEIVDEAAKQAHVLLEDGIDVPGYGLYEKKAGARSWIDEKKADAWLGRKGLDVNGRRVVKPISPAQAEKILKAAGNPITEKEAARYIAPGVSSGKKVARNSPLLTPAQSRAELTRELAGRLTQLTKQ